MMPTNGMPMEEECVPGEEEASPGKHNASVDKRALKKQQRYKKMGDLLQLGETVSNGSGETADEVGTTEEEYLSGEEVIPAEKCRDSSVDEKSPRKLQCDKKRSAAPQPGEKDAKRSMRSDLPEPRCDNNSGGADSTYKQPPASSEGPVPCELEQAASKLIATSDSQNVEQSSASRKEEVDNIRMQYQAELEDLRDNHKKEMEHERSKLIAAHSKELSALRLELERKTLQQELDNLLLRELFLAAEERQSESG